MPTFLNPVMWFGAFAIAIPLALHFFYRARYRPLPWAAMKFLRLSIEQTSRRLRFQEWVLLALRILVCLLLAMALARPAAESLSSGGGRGDSVDAIIVIDTSYSMSAKETEQATRLDRAKEAALKVIDNLPPNSTAQIISCSDKAAYLGPKSPSNLDQARHLVRNLKTAAQATDYSAAFNEAMASFEKTTGANKEVYLIGDMQRTGWEKQASAIRARCDDIKNQASIYLVRCADAEIKNVAVVDILPQTEIPHKGARIAFTVLLRNTGAKAVENVSLSLKVDGQDKFQDVESITVDKIGATETQAVTVTGKIEQAGWRLLTATITAKEDAIAEDNTFNRLLLVHERIRVLVIDGSTDERNPSQAGSFFLSNALLPIAEERRDTYHLTATTIRPDVASEGSLIDRDVCILVNVPADRLQADFVKALDTFVRSGKGLFITSGFNVVGKDYNNKLGDLLPAPLVDSEAYLPPRENPAYPDAASADVSSFLARMREKGNNPLQTLAVAFTLAMTPVDDPRTSGNKNFGRVLLRFNDGRPMLLSKTLGNGEVLMLTTSADLTWSFLCRLPAFVPFINGCMAELIQRSGSAFNRTAGESLKWAPPDLRKEYYAINPNGDREFLGKPRDIEGELRLKAFDTTIAGVYQIVASGDEVGERFVFNPELSESENLEPITDDQIDDLLDFKPVHLTTGFEGKDFTGTERSRKEWTIWVLMALLIFALGETVWAWVCGRAW